MTETQAPETQAQQVAAPNREPWSFDPLALIRFLRGGDFRLGAAEALRTMGLMERLAGLGRSPRSPEEAARWLSPLLCTSLRQQAVMPDRLRAFAAESEPQVLAQRTPVFREVTVARRVTPPAWWRRAALLVPLLLGLFVLAIVFLPPLQRSLSSPLPVPTPAPSIPSTGPAVPRAPEIPKRGWSLLPLAAMPPLVWLLVIRLRRSGRPVIDRRPYQELAHTSLRPESGGLQPFSGEGLSRSLQGMRAHRWVASQRPDARASARATAANSGRPVLVPGRRPRLPDYAIAVEAMSSRDHVTVLARFLSLRLSEESVPHTLYFFSGDLRQLRTDADAPITLADIAARYQEDVLIIIGDGETLLDPFSGRLRGSLGELEAWRLVVLLTPVPQRRWSWRERRLAEAGILVLAATPDGLRMLGEYLRAEGRKPRPALERPPARPGLLRQAGDYSARWHSDRVPSEAEREAALDAIALELSPSAYELVCVLALFPELRPDLTLYVAKNFKTPGGQPLVDDAAIAAIAALAWFRLGRMPNWLRLELARSLRPARLEDARRIYADWLMGSGRGAEITITADTLGELVGQDIAVNPASPMSDAIFLRFSNREELSELDLEVPDAVADAVRAKALRGERIGLIAALSLSGAMLGFAYLFSQALDPMLQLLAESLKSLVSNKILALIWVCSSLAGLAVGFWRALRDNSGSTDLYGPIPLAASLVSLIAVVALLVQQRGERDDRWELIFIIASIQLPCLAMGLAFRRRNWRDFVPRTLIAGTITYLPTIVLVAASAFVVAIGVSQSSDLPPGTFIVIVALHALGIAVFYAQAMGSSARMMFVYAFLGGLGGLGIAASIVILFEVVSALDWKTFVLATSMGFIFSHLACALAVRVARGAKIGAVAAICCVALLVQIAVFLVFQPSWVSDKTGIQLTLLGASLLFYPALPAVALLVPVALRRPEAIRRTTTWVTGAAAVIAGGLAVMAFVFAAQLLGFESLSKKGDAGPIPFLFVLLSALAVMSGFAAIPAAWAWIGVFPGTLRPERTLSSLLHAYRPDPQSIAIVLLWIIGLRYRLAGVPIDLTGLYLPAAALLAVRFGPAGLPVLLWGGVPLLIGFDVEPVRTVVAPGLYIAGAFLYRLIAEPGLRKSLTAVAGIGTPELAAVFLLGGTGIVLQLPGGVTLGGDLGFALGIAATLLGVAAAPRRAVAFAIGLALLLTLAGALLSWLFGRLTDGWLRLGYGVNPLSLVMLYEIGQAWTRMLVSPKRDDERNSDATILPATLALLAIDVVQRQLGYGSYAPGMAAPLVAFFAIGSMRTERSLQRAVIAALLWALGVWIASALVFLAFAALGVASFGDQTLMGGLVALYPAMIAAACVGWGFARWARGPGADWLQELRASQDIRIVEAPSLAPDIIRAFERPIVEGKHETTIEELDEIAIMAFQADLTEERHQRDPIQWAATQTKLGRSLARLGARGEGSARLQQAITAFQEALSVQTRTRFPDDWAQTQNDLAQTWLMVGRREAGTARFSEAIEAYRAVLQEWTRERYPIQWAATQFNLGDALLELGSRVSGTAPLEEAITTFREALKERTRERTPLDWAATQGKLGTALLRLGERQPQMRYLEEAVAIYRTALQTWDELGLTVDEGFAQQNLGSALEHIASLQGRPDSLREARAAFAAAEEAFERAGLSENAIRAHESLTRVDRSLQAHA